jgi:hypothetical protein
MQKQPHRTIERIAENRYWQNQPRMDDHEELGPSKDLELEGYRPPTLMDEDVRDRDAPRKP